MKHLYRLDRESIEQMIARNSRTRVWYTSFLKYPTKDWVFIGVQNSSGVVEVLLEDFSSSQQKIMEDENLYELVGRNTTKLFINTSYCNAYKVYSIDEMVSLLAKELK